MLDDTQGRERHGHRRQNRRSGAGSGRAHARDRIVAPPGLLTHHARDKPQPTLQIDLHDSVITDLHFSLDIGMGEDSGIPRVWCSPNPKKLRPTSSASRTASSTFRTAWAVGP